jgi:hypothetical protein
MKKLRIVSVFVLIVLIILSISNFAFATDPQATQMLSFQITAIDAIATSGNPSALVINSATAGSQLTSVTDAKTTYAVTTNGTGKKITGALDSSMPVNTSLIINLAAPSGASSAGNVTLTSTATNLVTGITQVAAPSNVITYTFNASVTAGVIPATTKTVTLTITN